MSDNLFDKIAIFGDIHFGLKGNLARHNQDCLDFLDWMVKICKEREIKDCLFLGDWHHNRKNVQVQTLEYSLKGMKILAENYERVWMLVGNHDLYFKNSRDVDSIGFASLYDNVEIISEPCFRGNVALVPWLTENDDVTKIMASLRPCKYMFGHFELTGYQMNNTVSCMHGTDPMLLMGGNDAPDRVFSGHFHKRQLQKSINYIGSPFAHNYADEWDEERGFVLLDWDGEPEFLDWKEGPKYRTARFDDLCKNPDHVLGGGAVHAKIRIPANIGWEDIAFIKETLMAHYGLREFILTSEAQFLEATDETESGEITKHLTTDELVVEEIMGLSDSDTWNKELLVQLYQEA